MKHFDPHGLEPLIGERVRQRRQELGLSQEEVAEGMRVAGFKWLQTTVAKTESASRPLRVNEVANLADVLRMPLDLLVDRPDEEEPTEEELGLRSLIDASHVKTRDMLRLQIAADAADHDAMRARAFAARARDEAAALDAQINSLAMKYRKSSNARLRRLGETYSSWQGGTDG